MNKTLGLWERSYLYKSPAVIISIKIYRVDFFSNNALAWVGWSLIIGSIRVLSPIRQKSTLTYILTMAINLSMYWVLGKNILAVKKHLRCIIEGPVLSGRSWVKVHSQEDESGRPCLKLNSRKYLKLTVDSLWPSIFKLWRPSTIV